MLREGTLVAAGGHVVPKIWEKKAREEKTKSKSLLNVYFRPYYEADDRIAN